MYTITLADGRKLTDLSKNGDNFVSKEKVDESLFKDNLATMTVSDGETEEVFKNMVFVQQMKWADGTYYLAFRKRTQTEIFNENVTDIQVALAELYEMMLGGM